MTTKIATQILDFLAGEARRPDGSRYPAALTAQWQPAPFAADRPRTDASARKATALHPADPTAAAASCPRRAAVRAAVQQAAGALNGPSSGDALVAARDALRDALDAWSGM